MREARKLRGWSQTQLAEAAGVSRPTVARIEAGQRVSLSTLTRVAAAVGLEVQIFVQQAEGDHSPTRFTP
ncbi:helix-turn-helix domain-containing protein [Tessaracoccus coleopterorum]|uniref:helix-turn-helix domain-containing protein n=1 Tax=Tessaracoccus coleopterorum TaxID=2714950 RepID=UPI0038CD4A7E